MNDGKQEEKGILVSDSTQALGFEAAYSSKMIVP